MNIYKYTFLFDIILNICEQNESNVNKIMEKQFGVGLTSTEIENEIIQFLTNVCFIIDE